MPKTRGLGWMMILAAFAVAGLMASGCGTEEGTSEDGSADIYVSPEGTPETLGKQMADATAISAKDGAIKDEQAEFIKLAKQYEEATGQKLKGIELSQAEMEMLRNKLENEEDVSYEGLIKDLLQRQEKIDELRAEIEELKGRLPMPVTVKRGDSHYAIAMDYLTNEIGLEEKEAKKAIERALITDRIVPGHEIWHFYEDGVYGTSVTQGSARVSPYFLNVQHEKKITTERDDAQDLAAHLQSELEILEHQRDELTAELEILERQYDAVVEERDVLEDENVEMETHMSSAHYYVDTQANLAKDGVVKIGGKKLKDYDPNLFIYTIDLRDDDTIRLAASAFDRNAILGAEILPNDLFVKNKDYSVDTSDKQRTVITLHNRDKFENQRFVVVLR